MANWSDIKTMSVKMKINTDKDGNIARSTSDIAGAKPVTIQGIYKDASLEQTAKVFDAFFVNIAGGSYDSLSATRTMTSGVVSE